MTMAALTPVYTLIGVVLAIAALHAVRDRSNSKRWSSALFWSLLALAFVAGDALPPWVVGVVVVLLGAIAGFGGVGRGAAAERDPDERRAQASRIGNRLFLPVLTIPAVTTSTPK